MKCPYCNQTPEFKIDIERYAQTFWKGGRALSSCCNQIIYFQPIEIIISLSKVEEDILRDDWGNQKSI